MNRRLFAALCLTVLSTTVTARADSPLNPSKEKWPTSAGGPQQAQDLKLKNLPVGKLLVLGNSITAHGPVPGIGWHGDWGMAASSADKDFVHVLAAQLGKAAGGQVKFMARNIADFERGHPSYDIAPGMKDELAFKPDLVVVAIGENVPDLASDEAKTKYREAMVRLLKTLHENSPCTIIVRSCFWANPAKDELMREAAEQTGDTYVDVSALGPDPANAARSERKVENDGVAGHPGDRGMQALADALFAAIEKKAAAEKP
jgi:GDSL-like Lipase/Acylhydrolase family